MSNKVWKRIVRFLIIFLIVVIGIIAFFCLSGSDGVLTGKQYLKAQEKYMAEFEAYADDMDNIVTLYLNGDIGEEDFLNHLQILQELNTMEEEYEDSLSAVRSDLNLLDEKYDELEAEKDNLEVKLVEALEQLEEYKDQFGEL